MAGNEQAPRKARGDAEAVLKADELPGLDYPEEEEHTSPGVDPKVADAIASLKRVQKNTVVRVSDVCELLSKRNSSSPPKPDDAPDSSE